MLEDIAVFATQINRYDEYGVPQAGFSGSFIYAGSMYLNRAMAAPWNMRNRQYNPTLGRFMQTDPIGIAGRTNLYAYVGNDPVNLVDPWGLLPRWTFFYDLICTVSIPSRPDVLDDSSDPVGDVEVNCRRSYFGWWFENSEEDLSRYFDGYGYELLLQQGRGGVNGRDGLRCSVWSAGAIARETGSWGQYSGPAAGGGGAHRRSSRRVIIRPWNGIDSDHGRSGGGAVGRTTIGRSIGCDRACRIIPPSLGR